MEKPPSINVFGILNIVFAALGMVGVLGSLVMFTPIAARSNNPVIQIIHDNAAYALWLEVSIALGLVACGALLAAGIGLLKTSPWARTLSMVYAVYAIVMALVGTVVNYFFMVQPMLASAQGKSGPEAAGAIGGAIGGMLGGCLGLIYPVLLLIFMMKANVKAAFQKGIETRIEG